MADHMTPGERGHRMLRESGYAHGGEIRHEDEAEDKKLIREELGKARIKAKAGGRIKGEHAKERPDRRARGGHVKGKPGIGKVNIVIAHGAGDKGADGPPAPMPVMAPRPPMAPPGPPPGAMPPRPAMSMPPPGGGAPMAGPPGGMPPGPMMRPQGIKSGGMVRDRAGRFAGGSIR